MSFWQARPRPPCRAGIRALDAPARVARADVVPPPAQIAVDLAIVGVAGAAAVGLIMAVVLLVRRVRRGRQRRRG